MVGTRQHKIIISTSDDAVDQTTHGIARFLCDGRVCHLVRTVVVVVVWLT